MATGWESALDEAFFGDIGFDAVEITGTRNRAIRTVEYDGIDGAQLVDQGAQPRTAQVTAVFVGEEQVTRFQELVALNDGRPHLFGHPLLGVYEARITGWQESVEAATSQIVVNLEFTEEGDDPDVLVIDEPLDVSGGGSSVAALSEESLAALETIIEDSPELAATGVTDAVAAAPGLVDAWAQTPPTPAQASADLATVTEPMDEGLRVLEARSDADAVAAHLSLLRLRLAMLATAEQVAPEETTARQTLEGATPALLLALERGGGEALADEILGLNPGASPLGLLGPVVVPR